MLNVFMAGQALVRWEVTSFGPKGPYRLAVYHQTGAIVEYFPSVPAALTRERELQDLLTIDHSMTEPTSEMVL
jgi:hypothetical protein